MNKMKLKSKNVPSQISPRNFINKSNTKRAVRLFVKENKQIEDREKTREEQAYKREKRKEEKDKKRIV